MPVFFIMVNTVTIDLIDYERMKKELSELRDKVKNLWEFGEYFTFHTATFFDTRSPLGAHGEYVFTAITRNEFVLSLKNKLQQKESEVERLKQELYDRTTKPLKWWQRRPIIAVITLILLASCSKPAPDKPYCWECDVTYRIYKDTVNVCNETDAVPKFEGAERVRCKRVN
jgi:tetrahydromethanopterin S-methyltransferase subunit G